MSVRMEQLGSQRTDFHESKFFIYQKTHLVSVLGNIKIYK